jgi:hypothetical protein
MENKSITIENLIRPYSEKGFKEQMLSCGISKDSIEEILSMHTEGKPEETFLYKLWADIDRLETQIKDGERHLQFTGVYLTDGERVLLERHPEMGKKGKGFGMGGLLAYGMDPTENILKEIREETPLTPDQSRLRLINETTDSSASPRLPEVMTHRTGFFFIYRADNLEDMPKMYQGSDGDPHELYVARIEDIAEDLNIAKGWKGDATKFGLMDKEYVSKLLAESNQQVFKPIR